MKQEIKQNLALVMSATMIMAQPGMALATELVNEENQQQVVEAVETENDEVEVVSYADVDPMVVYTQATKPNADTSGNGTKSNPYNRFEDAVANVADGGTIIIKSGDNAFLNTQDEYGTVPFVINKNITIKSEDSDVMGELVVRAGGIVLEGDVTFENINLAFANKLHDAIFANGYNLELINCTRGAGSRQVDVFAGSLYDKNGDLIEGKYYYADGSTEIRAPRVGNNASVLIKTNRSSIDSEFGKVFAGSLNSTFKGDASIEINRDKGSLDLISVYSCGADEPIIGGMFDITEPQPPKENAAYSVDGDVNIILKKYKTDVYGKGANETHVTLEAFYQVEYFTLNDIKSLTVAKGTVIPDSITWQNGNGDLIIKRDGVLELSKIKELTVENFTGGGKIILQKEGLLNIEGNVEEAAQFQTVGGPVSGEKSGIVKKEHVYINAPNSQDSSFTFNPNDAQKGYTFEQEAGEWQAIPVPGEFDIPTSLDSVYFEKTAVKWDTANSKLPLINFILDPQLEDGTLVDYIPFNFYVGGELCEAIYDEFAWESPENNIRIELGYDGGTDETYIVFCPVVKDGEFAYPEAGTYEIEMELPLYGLKTNVTLYVGDSSGSVSAPVEDSQTNVTFVVDGQDIKDDKKVNFGKTLQVVVAVGSAANGIVTTALQDEMELVINGKIVQKQVTADGSATFEVTVNKENGFTLGENEIKVLYGGSDVLFGSTACEKIQVEKVTPEVVIEDKDIVKTYDGSSHALNVSLKDLEDVKPVVYYYTNEARTENGTTVAPKNVGTYYVAIEIPETEMTHSRRVEEGKVTIEKVTPSIAVRGEVTPNQGAVNSNVLIQVDMIAPKGGTIPNGKVELTCTSENETLKAEAILNYGSATFNFDNVVNGTYTVEVNYIAEVNGTQDHNYESVLDASNKIVVSNSFASLKGVKLNKTETVLKETETERLVATLDPVTATDKEVSWKSSDESVVTVSADGVLTALKKGEATITVTTLVGDFTAECKVIVEAKPEEIKPENKPENGGSGETVKPENKPENGGSGETAKPDSTPDNSGSSGGGGGGGGGSSAPIAEQKPVEQKPTEEPVENVITSVINVETQFKDVKDSWAKTDIQFVVENGLFKGVSETKFGAKESMTRGMIVTVLHRLAGTPQVEANSTFKDVKDDAFYNDAVAWANALNIVTGSGDNKFNPNQSVTREQLAVMLYRFATITGVVKEDKIASNQVFKDEAKVSDWAKEAMNWAVSVGILAGNADNTLNPNGTATRAEVAAMINRFCSITK